MLNSSNSSKTDTAPLFIHCAPTKINSSTLYHQGRGDWVTLFFLTSTKTFILICLVFKEYKMGLMQLVMKEASDRLSTWWSGSSDRPRRLTERILKMGI